MRVSKRREEKLRRRGVHFPRPVLGDRSVRAPTEEEGAAQVASVRQHEALVQEIKKEKERLHASVKGIQEYLAEIHRAREKGRQPRLAKKETREGMWNMHLVT